MLLFIEHLHEAHQSFKKTRTRSLLTIAGIAIGIASVTTIMTLSDNITSVIDRQVNSLDQNLILIRPREPKTNPSRGLLIPGGLQLFNTSTLTEQDVEEIEGIKNISSVAPIMIISANLKSHDVVAANSLIIATYPEITTTSILAIQDGQFIDSATNHDTAVIGNQLSIDLFGTNQSIGRVFSVREQNFTVIGVLKNIDDPINFNTLDYNNAAIINLKAGMKLTDGKGQIQQINVSVTKPEKATEVAANIKETLLKTRDFDENFVVLTGKDIAEPTNQIFYTTAAIMAVIATISIIVGGIGIMNILLVGVAERTREIGLRKAVGASNRNIFDQFLMESILVSLSGGLTGYLFGTILSLIITKSYGLNPNFNINIALTALGLSLIVGILFGLFPAIKAARKDPIESLRQFY